MTPNFKFNDISPIYISLSSWLPNPSIQGPIALRHMISHILPVILLLKNYFNTYFTKSQS